MSAGNAARAGRAVGAETSVVLALMGGAGDAATFSLDPSWTFVVAETGGGSNESAVVVDGVAAGSA
jgi:hypothetical protein